MSQNGKSIFVCASRVYVFAVVLHSKINAEGECFRLALFYSCVGTLVSTGKLQYLFLPHLRVDTSCGLKSFLKSKEEADCFIDDQRTTVRSLKISHTFQ